MVQAPKEQAQYDNQVPPSQGGVVQVQGPAVVALSQKELLEQQREKLYQKAAEYGVKPEERNRRSPP